MADKAAVRINVVPVPLTLLAVRYPDIYRVLEERFPAQLLKRHLLKVCPAHLGAASGACASLEPVAAGDADVVDPASASAQHAAKSSASARAAHSHASHRAPAHIVGNAYENCNCRYDSYPAKPPSQNEAYGKGHHYPCHLLTYPVQLCINGYWNCSFIKFSSCTAYKVRTISTNMNIKHN